MRETRTGVMRRERGITVLLVLVFMAVFSLLLSGIVGFALEQSRYGRALYAREQALHIAEAGLEYYRWYLVHAPSTVLDDGTGLDTPQTYTVSDPEGGDLGSATITATPAYQCGKVQWIDLTSVGTADVDAGFPRTLSARFMRTSVAEYSYIVGNNVWAGPDRDIKGPYHSNGGIIMDGTNNSDVTSSVSTWWCDSSFSSSRCPTGSYKPGVWGDGSGSLLWSYPESTIDFNGMSVDLSGIETAVQSSGGLHFDPASGSVNSRGYHLVFNSDGTVTVYRVTSTDQVYGYSTQQSPTWQWEYNTIASETLVGTYAIPSSCSVIYVNDRVWIEGVVEGKVTVIAATPSDGSTSPDILLPDNITYADQDGTDGLTAIAERNILITLSSPDYMEIHGIFIAANGRYGRNAYVSYEPYTPSKFSSNTIQTSLTTIGTVVSLQRTGTAYTSGGTVTNGYQNRYDYYDRVLAFAPPPFTSVATSDYGLVLWREQ